MGRRWRSERRSESQAEGSNILSVTVVASNVYPVAGVCQQILFETSAPRDSLIALDEVPEELRWKFLRNNQPREKRHWLKLEDEVC